MSDEVTQEELEKWKKEHPEEARKLEDLLEDIEAETDAWPPVINDPFPE